MLRDVRMVGALPALHMRALVWVWMVPRTERLDREVRHMQGVGMMSIDELKPCPFCGRPAHLRKGHFWYAYCARAFNGCVSMGPFLAKAEATEAWNTRVERTCKSVTDYGYRFRFACSACGYVALVHNCSTRYDEVPNYCPNCGAKVVDK